MKIMYINNNEITYITFEDAYKEFYLKKRAKGLSEKTLQNYDDAYKYFTNFFDEKRLCHEIDVKVYTNCCLLLKGYTNANDVSRQTYLRHLKVILNFCMEQQYMKYFHIELPKAEAKLKCIYTEHELDLLLKKPNMKTCQFTEYRNWVLINYLIATRSAYKNC